MTQKTPLQLQILDLIKREGPVSSKQIQAHSGASQATVSRALTGLAQEILTFGASRTTVYAIQKAIHGRSGSQPIFNVNERGRVSDVGRLDLLEGNKVRVELGDHVEVVKSELPWFLSTLKLEGYLGRLQAQTLADEEWDTNPERWSVDQVLAVALSLYDVPGSLILGDTSKRVDLPKIPALNDPELFSILNKESNAVADSTPAGSSAGGEQPKFLATQDGKSVIIKFSPPGGTPYGDRWSDLMICESIASLVLSDNGYAAAVNHTVNTGERTFLISERFDRTNDAGRRHVVSLGAAHKGLLKENYQHWGATAERLAQIKALSKDDAQTAQAVLEFGRLIGNTDMHSGNLAFYVDIGNLNKGGLTIAPIYDMLPMRWRPNIQQRDLPSYTPFQLDERSLSEEATPMALEFWDRVCLHEDISDPLKQVAKAMKDNLSNEICFDESSRRPKMK